MALWVAVVCLAVIVGLLVPPVALGLVLAVWCHTSSSLACAATGSVGSDFQPAGSRG